MDSESKKKLDEILAKPAEMLDEYDKSILRARQSYLTEEEAEKFAEVLKVEEEESVLEAETDKAEKVEKKKVSKKK